MSVDLSSDLLRETVLALKWVAECKCAVGGDHIEALQLLRELAVWIDFEYKLVHATSDQIDRYESSMRASYLMCRTSVIDRDARSRASDLLRAARSVVRRLAPVEL